jgi:hypothetical protein
MVLLEKLSGLIRYQVGKSTSFFRVLVFRVHFCELFVCDPYWRVSTVYNVKVRCIFVHGFSNIRTPKYRLPRIFSLVCKYVLHNMELISPNQI